jgi:hypothetical protein
MSKRYELLSALDCTMLNLNREAASIHMAARYVSPRAAGELHQAYGLIDQAIALVAEARRAEALEEGGNG